MTTFSFHPVKTIAMGEGGAITTDDESLVARLRSLRNHGMVRDPTRFTERNQAFDEKRVAQPWYYEMHEPGLNYRASDIHCALGLSQLSKLRRFVETRRSLVSRYDELFAPYAPLVRPIERVIHCKPAWHLYPVRIDFLEIKTSRRALMEYLREHGIGTQVHYLPVHLQPYYRQSYGHLTLPGANSYYRQILSLPLYVDLSYSQAEFVVDHLISCLHDPEQR